MRFPLLARGSLRVRLIAGSVIWILAALTLTGFVLADLFGKHVAARFEAELQIHLEQLVANLESSEDGRPRLRADLSDPRLRRPYSGLYWQVDGAGDGEVALLRSRSLWDAVLVAPADVPADGEAHVHRIDGPDTSRLIMTERMIRPAEQPEQPLRLIVAADQRGMTDPVREFVGLLAIALVVLAAGLVAAAALQVAVGLAPLRRLRHALGEVRDGRTRRLAGEYPRELQPLVDELNTLLRNDADIVARARTQAGNLAHAVKTPLAVLANAAGSEDGALARLVREQVASARRQVDHHLARARAAAAIQVPGLRTPIGGALAGLVRVMERVHAERALRIDVAPVASGDMFRGEEQDLQEMLGNLLDNACKWAASRVSVQVTRDDGKLAVVIDDDGQGLPPAEREAMFVRGVRADEQVAGSGLGLAIVRDLARLYGGDVSLDASPLGGLRVTLTLPAAA